MARLGPLHGLPVGVKDVIDTADMPSQYNSPIWRGHRPRADAAAVAWARDAGAVIAGKTVATEFANRHPGPKANPHDPRRTPGGSSSGSAAAVADHFLPLAFGTQTAGSIIGPAPIAAWSATAELRPDQPARHEGLVGQPRHGGGVGRAGAQRRRLRAVRRRGGGRRSGHPGCQAGARPAHRAVSLAAMGPGEPRDPGPPARRGRAPGPRAGAAVRECELPPAFAALVAAHPLVMLAESARALGLGACSVSTGPRTGTPTPPSAGPSRAPRFPIQACNQFVMESVPRWATTDRQIMAAYDALVQRVCPCVVVVHSRGGYFGPTPPCTARTRCAPWLGRVPRQCRPSMPIMSSAQQASDADVLDLLRQQGERIARKPFASGDELELLRDGPATYAAMSAAIRSASAASTWKATSSRTVKARFADLLLARRAVGVEVNLIYDAWGSHRTGAALFDRLRKGGVRVLEYNPLAPNGRVPIDINRRNHRKLLIVDGAVVITGRVNITRVYENGAAPAVESDAEKLPWRDTDVRIKGPVVAQFSALFMETWREQRGPRIPEPPATPGLTSGSVLIQAIDGAPEDRRPLIYRTLVAAITLARKSVVTADHSKHA
jgi:Amidase/PLD-like domain